MDPKVLVGSPVSTHHLYCTEKYLGSIKTLTYKNYDILLVDNSPTNELANTLTKHSIPFVQHATQVKEPAKKILECALYLRNHALDNGYDYLLILEQDIIPPRDVIELFLQDKKPALTGVYHNFRKVDGQLYRIPVLYTWLTKQDEKYILENKAVIKEKNHSLIQELDKCGWDFSMIRKQVSMADLEDRRLLKVKTSGAGCLFISREILQKVPFRSNTDGFYDVLFGLDLEKAQIPFYADTKVVCEHLLRGRPWTWKGSKIEG